MRAKIASFRTLLYTVAAHSELGEFETDRERGEKSRLLVQWLLPVIKTLGGEIAFDTASEAIQILGGAGYTVDWPVEQALRDARVLTIFEGTTGIQAADLLHRGVWRDQAVGLEAFLQVVRDDLRGMSADDIRPLEEAVSILELATNRIADKSRGSEAGAVPYLHLVGHCALAWGGLRLKKLGVASIEEQMAIDIELKALPAKCQLESAYISALR
jgi:hypothetical protein